MVRSAQPELPITHVGLTVPDLDAALVWYEDVLGYVQLTPPGEITCGQGRFGAITEDIWGNDWSTVRMAHIGSGRGTVIELFAYPDYDQPDSFEFRRVGFSHLCVVDSDLEGLTARAVAGGGRQRSQIWTMFENLPYQMVYLEDPWGNAVEGYSHSHSETYQLGRTTDSSSA